MRFVASVLVLCAIISFVKCDPLWKVFCQETPLYRGRADPIVDPGKLAQHSHKVFGGNAFDYGNPSTSPESYYDQIFASSCTTCSITIDKSVYWVPDLYYRWDNGSISLVPNGGLTIYYPSRSGSGNQTHPDWKPIPRGLRIVAGQSTRRYYNESIVEHKAVSYACLSEPGGPETGEFPTATRFCKNGLRAQVWFPMCWDGKNLDSANHMSHMSYPIDGRPDGGNCPSTHPVRFPGVFYELLFSVDKFPHGDGVSRFLWSNGDVTGNGLHGDFLNGWDPEIMAAAIADPSCDQERTCIGNCPEKCAPFTPYVKKNNPDQSCHLMNPMPGTEDLGVGHFLSHLPGCNPITNANPNKVVTPCTGSWPQDSNIDVKVRVAIRGTNNKYATNFNQTTSWAATVSQDILGYTEMFSLIPQGNGLVGIQSEATTRYCSDNQRGDIPLLFNRGGPSDWEFFSINYTGSDTAPTAAGAAVKIKANSNGQYLVLNSDSTIQSSAKTFAEASVFYLVDPNAGVTDTRSNKNDPAFTHPAPPPSTTPPANSEGGEPDYYPTTAPTSPPSNPTSSPKPTSSPSNPTSSPSNPTSSPKPTSSSNPTSSPKPTSPSNPTSSPKPTSSSNPTSSPSTTAPVNNSTNSNSTVAPTQPATNITKGTTGPEFLATSAASSVYAAFASLAMFVIAMM